MQAMNAIQNAMSNTTTAAQAGMVATATNAHRSYLRLERGVRPDSKRPHFGVSGSHSLSEIGDSKPGLPTDETSGTDPKTMCSDQGSSWRSDSRQLPGAAWAMLVLSRSLCG